MRIGLVKAVGAIHGHDHTMTVTTSMTMTADMIVTTTMSIMTMTSHDKRVDPVMGASTRIITKKCLTKAFKSLPPIGNRL